MHNLNFDFLKNKQIVEKLFFLIATFVDQPKFRILTALDRFALTVSFAKINDTRNIATVNVRALTS